MRFLILGCNGMAGHMISLYLKEQGHSVTGYARQRSKFVYSIIGDATDYNLLKRVIYQGNYDSVINCIGLLNQDAENDHPRAVALNSYLPHYLAQITENTDIQIIHMSTDCVFSGKKGGYTEMSVTDGTYFYDRSKALGELIDHKNVTFRNSIVGPDIKESGIGLLNWFMKQEGNVNGYAEVIWTGQTTLQLAKTMEKAAKCRIHGLYNAVPKDAISKYYLLVLFNKYIRKASVEIRPVNDIVSDKSLIRTNYAGFPYEIPDYETMIKELGDWMREHRDLYPHYEI